MKDSQDKKNPPSPTSQTNASSSKSSKENTVRQNRIYNMFRQTKDAVLQIKERQKLLDRICQIVLENGNFILAWIGMVDWENQCIRAEAAAGHRSEYAKDIFVSIKDEPAGQGPTGRAVRSGRTEVCDNILEDPRMVPWRARALERGYKSSAAIPLLSEGRLIGTMNIYAAETGYFTAKEVGVLEELCGHISFALSMLEHEDRQQRAEEILCNFFSSAPAALALLDEHKKVVKVNAAMAGISGFLEEQLAGRPIAEIIPQFREFLDTGYQKVWETKQAWLNQEISSASPSAPNENRFWVASCFPVRVEGDKIKYFGFALAEITERKKAQEALRRLEESYNLINNNIKDTIWVLDMNLKTTFISPSVEKMLGFSLAELQAMPFETQMTKESYHKFLNFLARGVTQENLEQKRLKLSEMLELEFIRHDGTTIWTEIQITLMRDLNGLPAGFLNVGREVSERKQMEAERAQLEEQLQQAQKMELVGRLAGGIAHDFNNLLLPILGNAEMALLKLPRDNPLYNDLEPICQAAEKAATLTRQLLAFSRKQQLELRTLNLNHLIQDFSKVLGRLLPENVKLRYQMDTNLGLIRADAMQLQQILLNLAINARDAMPAQGGEVIIQTSNRDMNLNDIVPHHQMRPGRYVHLSVRDNGRGMDGETLKHIYEPFFSTKKSGEGTGLGLSMVYGIVKQHHGIIDVASAPEQGTLFNVFFPVVDAVAEVFKTLPPIPDVIGHQEHLLVVDDDNLVREMVTQILSMGNYKVTSAANPQAALDLIGKSAIPPRLLITDMIMPQMNGKELFQALSRYFPEMQVLYISGYLDDCIAQDGKSPGNFLAKPFSSEVLMQKIKEVLQN